MKSITGSDIGAGVIGALVALWAINRIQSPAGTPTPMPTPTPIPTPTHPYYIVGDRLVNISGNHLYVMRIVGTAYDILDEDGVIGLGPLARVSYDCTSLDLNPSWWLDR